MATGRVAPGTLTRVCHTMIQPGTSRRAPPSSVKTDARRASSWIAEEPAAPLETIKTVKSPATPLIMAYYGRMSSGARLPAAPMQPRPVSRTPGSPPPPVYSRRRCSPPSKSPNSSPRPPDQRPCPLRARAIRSSRLTMLSLPSSALIFAQKRLCPFPLLLPQPPFTRV